MLTLSDVEELRDRARKLAAARMLNADSINAADAATFNLNVELRRLQRLEDELNAGDITKVKAN